MKMLINCGMTVVWHAESYPDSLAEAMAGEAGVRLRLLAPEPEAPSGVAL
jgi:hypothetical protein